MKQELTKRIEEIFEVLDDNWQRNDCDGNPMNQLKYARALLLDMESLINCNEPTHTHARLINCNEPNHAHEE